MLSVNLINDAVTEKKRQTAKESNRAWVHTRKELLEEKSCLHNNHHAERPSQETPALGIPETRVNTEKV